jgi:hypothetical protein
MRKLRSLFLLGAGVVLPTLLACGGSSQPSPSSPTFTVMLSAQSVFVPTGAGSGVIQVSVQAVNGFSQAVSVSFSGLPPGGDDIACAAGDGESWDKPDHHADGDGDHSGRCEKHFRAREHGKVESDGELFALGGGGFVRLPGDGRSQPASV